MKLKISNNVLKLTFMSLFFSIASSSAYADPINSINFHNIDNCPLPATALLDNAPSIAVNPGGIGWQEDINLYLSKSITGLSQVNAFGTLGIANLGFQRFSPGLAMPDIQRYSVGAAYPIFDGLNVGITYNFSQIFEKETQNVSSYDLGALYRLSDMVSLGFTVRNVNQPTYADMVNNKDVTINRVYQGGVGIRPFGNRLSLSVDGIYKEEDSFYQITGFAGLSAEPFDGFVVNGRVNLDGSFSVGMGINFEQLGLGYFRSFNTENTKDAAYVNLSLQQNRTAMNLPDSQMAKLDLSGLQNSPSTGFFSAESNDVWGILRQIKMVKEDPKFKGIIIKVDNLNCGLGTLEEVRNAIIDLNKTKETVAYISGGDSAEYYMASAAKSVVVPPTGYVSVKGFSFVLPYYKGFLDKIGVQAQFQKIGKYKSAAESITEDGISEGNKEQMNSIIDDLYERFVSNIAVSRNLSKEKVKESVDKGIVTPTKAKELGLIDNVGYLEDIQTLYPLLPKENMSLANTQKRNYSWKSPKIAVVYAEGEIVDGNQTGGFFSDGNKIAGSSFARLLKSIREDDSIQALVLRVNSPGGATVASDIILHELQKFKNKNKPVVVSMADMAGSGGYWISCSADKIISNPSTITGSIGIIFGKLNFENLYKKLDIKYEVIKRGQHADAFSGHRALTDEEKNILMDTLKEGYGIFLDRVSKGRGKKIEEVDQLGRGRVYTGEQAKGLGLVDSTGGFEDALKEAKSLAKIDENTKVKVVFYTQEQAAGLANMMTSLKINMQESILKNLLLFSLIP